jgi:diguanylate cyclase (GGDEF)-like protein
MATKENGIAMAERIRTAIEKGKVFREPNAGVTVSIGVAQHNNQEEVKSFIDRTDQIMYNAKKDGKNRISS